MTYKDYEIKKNIYGFGEWSVQYCGDDIVFDTIADAKQFIDGLYED